MSYGISHAKPQRALAHVHVELEAGQYVGFVIDGAKVERVIHTHNRAEAETSALARAARINRNRIALTEAA